MIQVAIGRGARSWWAKRIRNVAKFLLALICLDGLQRLVRGLTSVEQLSQLLSQFHRPHQLNFCRDHQPSEAT